MRIKLFLYLNNRMRLLLSLFIPQNIILFLFSRVQLNTTIHFDNLKNNLVVLVKIVQVDIIGCYKGTSVYVWRRSSHLGDEMKI